MPGVVGQPRARASTPSGSRSGLYDEVEVVGRAPTASTVEVDGRGRRPGAARRARTSSCGRCARALDVVGDAPPGLRLRCRNAIPHSRGLGSSAAAAVAGAVAAAALAGRDLGAGARGVAAGHGRYGGPRRQRGGQPARRVRRRLGRADGNTPAVPRCTTRRAPGDPPGRARRRTSSRPPRTTRGLLPDRVPLADAAFTGSRTALAVLAFTQRPDLLLPATEDRLHQEYRRPAYPESAALVDALRAAGVPAVISGAGPTVLALTADGALPSDAGPARLHRAAAAGRPVRCRRSRSA